MNNFVVCLLQANLKLILCCSCLCIHGVHLCNHSFFEEGRVQPRNSILRGNIGVKPPTPQAGGTSTSMDVHLCSRPAPDGNSFLFFIIYLSIVTLFSYLIYYLTMVTFALYFISLFTPLWFVLSEGEGVRVPATSYLVSLFTLIYLVLFSPFTAITPGCTLLFKQ